MPHNMDAMGRSVANFFTVTRKKGLLLLLSSLIAVFVISTYTAHLPCEKEIEPRIADLQAHLKFLESLYRSKLEYVMNIQKNPLSGDNNVPDLPETTTMSSEVRAVLKNITGTRAAAGLLQSNLQNVNLPLVFQLLPHLLDDPNSVRPAYHMTAGKLFADVVIGVPHVKRDKENYLMITLTHLVKGLSAHQYNSTLIVVMIGETDIEYALETANQIETRFPKLVEMGVIEVILPSPSYYPDMDSLPLSLGDSLKRVKWRTKQNLDAIYMMAYAQTRGTYYLMLEDDVIAKDNYMTSIKEFTAATSVSVPDWIFIEFCQTGGIGKLFKSANLLHFITYVQLFYSNMPIDWLLESYLADKVCTIDKGGKACSASKTKIRPKHATSLFQHIGLYSSLKGKIQKVKDAKFGTMPTFYAHKNPPLQNIKTSMTEKLGHTLKKAYDGESFFWGATPRKNDFVEFWFETPTLLEKYLFRSGNVDHLSDKFIATNVEVLPVDNENFTIVGTFDEFGLAETELKKDIGPLKAIRLIVNAPSKHWVILSEIELKSPEDRE